MLNRFEKLLSKENNPNPEIISVRGLQVLVGTMGMFLALFLLIGNLLVGECGEFQPTVSHYYYTNMRDFFVGTLYAVAVFLFCYKGYSKWDDLISTVAAIAAVVTATVPINRETMFRCQFDLPMFLKFPHHEYLHMFAATTFLFSLAFMSIFLFTQSESGNLLNKRKLTRNKVYRFCGYLIVVCIVSSGVVLGFGLLASRLIYVFETLALFAFGFSWLTKAKVFWPDLIR